MSHLDAIVDVVVGLGLQINVGASHGGVESNAAEDDELNW